MTVPSPNGLEEIVTDLDRLHVPATASRTVASTALQSAGRGVATNRLRAALAIRRQRDGIAIAPRQAPAPKATRQPHRAPWPAVLTAMVDGRLIGAACVGRHELFDAELDGVPETATERATRHAAAVAICRTCPVRDTCRDVADETGQQARGVWAGTLRNVSRPTGRPREELTI